MSTHSFTYGEKFLFHGMEYQVTKEGKSEIEIKNLKYEKREFWQMSDLLTEWGKGNLIFQVRSTSENIDVDFDLFPEHIKKVALMRYRVIEPFIKGKMKTSDLGEYLNSLPKEIEICQATFYNWKKSWDQNEDIRYLIPNKRGPKKRRMSKEIKIVEELIDGLNSGEKISYRSLYQDFKRIVNDVNQYRDEQNRLKKISYDTFLRSAKEIKDTYKINLARHGKIEADLKQKGSRKEIIVERPLERVEIDWTPVDILLVNPKTLERQKPWLIYAIDVYSGHPLGFYVTFDPPNTDAIKQCILHCLLPKTYLKELYPLVQKEWVAYGKPSLLVLDNHKVNESYDLENACLVYDIHVDYCTVGAGHQKGTIERAIRTVNEIIHSLPGTTFSNTLERSQYDSEGKACITLQGFYYIAHIAFVDLIANAWSSKRKGTPHDIWEKGLENDPHLRLALPRDIKELKITMGCGLEFRKITNKGITLKGRHFISQELMDLGNKLEQLNDQDQVRVRFDASDLRVIFIYDPYSKRYIEAFADEGAMIRDGIDFALPVPYDQIALDSKKDNQEKRNFDDTHMGIAQQRIQEIVKGEQKAKRQGYPEYTDFQPDYLGVALKSISMDSIEAPVELESIHNVKESTPKRKPNFKKKTREKEKKHIECDPKKGNKEEKQYIEYFDQQDFEDLPTWKVSYR